MSNVAVRRLRASNGWRRSPATVGGPVGHKEWMHFCVFGRTRDDTEVDVLLNFSLVDGVQTIGYAGVEVARLLALVRIGNQWHGGVTRYQVDAVTVAAGSSDFEFGESRVALTDSGYDVKAELEDLKIHCLFAPQMSPWLTPSAAMRPGYVRWLVTPMVWATGLIEVGHHSIELIESPAYHDHNWGQFRWGSNFAWQWAIAVEERARPRKCLVVSRVTDRARSRVFSQSVIVGDGERFRDFRSGETTYRQAGIYRRLPGLIVPSVMRLLLPPSTADLASRRTISCEANRDNLRIDLRTTEYAGVGIPNDDGSLGVSVLAESCCAVEASGQVGGRAFEFAGRGLWEETYAA